MAEGADNASSEVKKTRKHGKEETILIHALDKSNGIHSAKTEHGNNIASGDGVASQESKGRSKSVTNSHSPVTDGDNGRRKSEDKAKCAKSNVKRKGSNAEAVDDQMNYEHLKELEKIFQDAKSEGADGLSMDQFRIAMKKTMGEHIDDRQLDLMFMKVDNNCDGTVDWDEYLSYMLLEYQEKENMSSMSQEKPFPNPMVEKTSNHIESICRIAMLQATSSRAVHDDTSDADAAASRYLTLSKEGIFNVWNLDWHLQKTINLKGNTKSIWFTDMACLANCNGFVVSSSDYEISFYSITSNLIQKKFQIKGLGCCALTLDYCYNQRDPQKSILLWGDTDGNIFVIRFYENPSVAIFSNSKFTGGKASLDGMIRMNSSTFKIFKMADVHGDWVQQVRYFTNKKGQECFISCCVKEDSALFFADISESSKHDQFINRKSYFKINKGVLCLTYDAEWNMVVTGSRDCDVRVWNPFIVGRSLAVLKGHHAAIMQLVLRKNDHHVVSISKDFNVRVWDLRYYNCKQNINGKNVCLGRLDVTSAYYHEKHHELVIGTNRIGVFLPKHGANSRTSRKQATSHHQAVTCVLYNKLFHQIVSGGEDSMVCMWDMNTGKKTMQFCAQKGVEITSMTFDPTWRRLVTGLRNGDTMLWNFNNGACLRRISNSDGLEISDIIFSKQRIVTAGWAKQPIVYMDSYSDDRCFPFGRKHGDDIMSLDYHRKDSILASSAYDGDIYLWSLETQNIIVAFNMHKSLLPMHIGGQRKNNEDDKHKRKTSINAVNTNESSSSASSGNRSNDSIGSTKSKNHNQKDANAALHDKPTHDAPMYTPSGTEINKADIWLPKSMPWLKTSKERSAPKLVHFAKEDEEESDDEDMQLEEEPYFEITEKAVYKLCFLQTRSNCHTVAMLFAANDMGWISAWSVNQRGGLLGCFRATKQDTDMVITMETDSEDKILITGDSRGYIRVWQIEHYCNGQDVMRHRERIDAAKGRTAKDRCKTFVPHYMPISKPPEQQVSFRGHTKAVTSIAYIERHELLASGSVDCSIRFWTISGRYIGTFGQMNGWNLELPVTTASLPTRIPEDIRRIASTTTLKTIKGGFHTQWKQVKNAVNFFIMAGHASFGPSPDREKKQRKMSIKNRFVDIENEMLEESGKKPNSRRKSVTVWVGDVPHAITVMKKPIDKVENRFLEIQKEGITSNVLGKSNYKPKKRHRESKIDKNIKWFNQHAAVYNALPYAQLAQPPEPALPDYLKKRPSFSDPSSKVASNTFYSALARHKAGAMWQRKFSKPCTDANSLEIDKSERKLNSGKNHGKEIKLPNLSEVSKHTKKSPTAKYTPLKLPSIAT